MIGGEVRRASWVWMDEQGTYFVPIKYGRFPLELKKGMFSVQCQNLDECEHVLCTFRTMILAGELDDHQTKASTERSEERRVGNEGVSTWRSRGAPKH